MLKVAFFIGLIMYCSITPGWADEKQTSAPSIPSVRERMTALTAQGGGIAARFPHAAAVARSPHLTAQPRQVASPPAPSASAALPAEPPAGSIKARTAALEREGGRFFSSHQAAAAARPASPPLAAGAADSPPSSRMTIKAGWEFLRRKSPDQTYALVLGISPDETEHPLVTARLPHVLLLSGRTSTTHSEGSFLPPNAFFIDFNGTLFQTVFVEHALGQVARVYFDWSTFKFAQDRCLQSLFVLLPKGGQVIIPTPVTENYAILGAGESAQDFIALPHHKRFHRNLENRMQKLRDVGFHVEDHQATDLLAKGDRVLAAIMKHVRDRESASAHPEIYEFILVATKK